MKMSRNGLSGIFLAALLTGAGGVFGDIALTRVADGYRVSVDAGTVPTRSYLTLAWGEVDAGEDLTAWPQSRVLTADLSSRGGTFTADAEGIPDGSCVRAFITQNIALLDGAIELKDQVSIDTGCSEAGAYGIDVGLQLTGRSSNWASVMGATLDAFTIGTDGSDLSRLYLRFAMQDTGARASLDNSQCNQIVIGDGAWVVNGETVADGYPVTALCPVGVMTIHLGSTASRERFTSGYWYWARILNQQHAPLADLRPAREYPSEQVGFYDFVKERMVYGFNGGALTATGSATNTLVRTLSVSSVAEAADPTVVVEARWTGEAGDDAVGNPRNWDCRNTMNEVVEGALPGLSAAVHLEGDLALNFTADNVLTGRTFRVDGTLTADSALLGTCVTALDGMGQLDIPGGNYLDTGFYPTDKTHIVMDLTVQGAREYWFGAWNEDYKDGAFCLGNDGAGVYAGFGDQGGTVNAEGLVPLGRHVVELDRGVVKVDGAVFRTLIASDAFQVNYPLTLCAQNRKGAVTAYPDQLSMRLHACRIYEDDVLVRDYVPVQRPSDLTAGLLERVSDTFVTFTRNDVTCAGATHVTFVRPPAPLVFSAGRLELDGHNLALAGMDGAPDMEICNRSSTPSTVTASIPADAVSRLSIQLDGNLGVVKTGAGTLVANRENGTFTGGLHVAAGMVRNGRSFGYKPLWGPAGAWITVDAGAVLDNDGYLGVAYSYDIAGDGLGEGALVNKVSPLSMNGAFWQQDYIADMRLSADASINVSKWWGFCGKAADDVHALTFNGHTLTVCADDQFFLRGVVAQDQGTFATFSRSGRLSFFGLPSDFSKVTVVQEASGRVSVEEPVTFGAYVTDATAEESSVLQTITVAAAFVPKQPTLYRPIRLGAGGKSIVTLDLSHLEEPFPIHYAADDPTGTLRSLTVEPETTVVIDLGARVPVAGLQVVDWTAHEAAAFADVPFTLPRALLARGYRLVRRETGLYLDAGFMIIVR